MQDVQRCNAKGKDCIEKNSAQTFNCSTTCVGIYAEVQWIGKTINEADNEKFPEGKDADQKAKDRDDDELQGKVLRRLANLEKEMVTVEGAVAQKGEELDKKKYKLLIAE